MHQCGRCETETNKQFVCPSCALAVGCCCVSNNLAKNTQDEWKRLCQVCSDFLKEG